MKINKINGIIGTLVFSAVYVQALPINSEPVINHYSQEGKSFLTVNRQNRFPKSQIKASAVSSSLVFYEDFESATNKEPFTLPAGWTSIANPQAPDDEWKAGTLEINGMQLAGRSGIKYAYLFPLPTTPHDTWMFTPAFELNAGSTYKFNASAIMLKGISGVEDLDIVLCSAPDGKRDSQIESILRTNQNADNWTKLNGYISVEESGTYYIGFHAVSDANAGGIIIDDVSIVDYMAPVFYGRSSITFDDTLDVYEAMSKEYNISNDGYSPLEVNLQSCSPEITIEGLPATIGSEETKVINVKLDVKTAGNYEGEIVFSTNDPLSPTVRIPVYQKVQGVTITDGFITTFDNGTPKGFEYSTGSANVIGKGIRDSRAPIGNTFYGLGNEDGYSYIATNFVNMGDNPRLSFWYKAQMSDNMFNDLDEVAPADHLQLKVMITTDYGRSWKEVYAIGPDKNVKHNPVMDFQYVDINLDEFKNEICQAKIMFSYYLQAGQSDVDILTNPIRFKIDNLSIGTVPEMNLSLTSLQGAGAILKGEKYTYGVTVDNLSSKEYPEGYKIKIEDNKGNEICTINGEAIPFGEAMTYPFDFIPSNPGSISLTARIIDSRDGIESDNMSIPLNISVLSEDNTQHVITTTESDKLLNSMVEPITFNAEFSTNVHLYYADELGINRGEINSIAYSVDGDAVNCERIQFYIGETTDRELTGKEPLDLENMTLVFDGKIQIPKGQRNLVIPFDKPYQYKGGNLLIRNIRDNAEYTYGRWGKISVTDVNRTLNAYSYDSMEDAVARQTAMPQYPSIIINMNDSKSGSLKGQVIDKDGKALNNVAIAIEGEGMTAKSDSQGSFAFPMLAPGTYTFTGYLAGYYETNASTEIKKDEEATITLVMNEINQILVTGKIRDTEGNAVAGSALHFEGEISADAISDKDGNFETLLYDDKKYNLTVSSPYYNNFTKSFKLEGKDPQLICTVRPEYNPPFGIEVSKDDGNAKISWNEPLRQLHHDTGIYESCLGYPTGWSEVIFGTAFHEKATVKEVSWYMSTEGGDKHSNFNVFVFGLTNGYPDPKKILYQAENVDFTDNAWNTHVLTKPVKADGFMIALSCAGYMGIGYTEATEEYPYVPNTVFYAGDSFNYTITEVGNGPFRDCHWMLRAGIESDDDSETSKPEILSYNVYRKKDNNNSNWDKISDTTELYVKDNLLELEEGRYRWSVTALYENGESFKVSSQPVSTSGINYVELDNASVTYNSATQTLELDGAIERVDIYDISGVLISRTIKPDNSIEMGNLVTGIYTAVVFLDDESVIIKKFIR